MNFLDITLFGVTAWRIALVATLFLGYAIFKIHSMRAGLHRNGTMTADGRIAYTNAPTVRLTDTQRIDRLQKIVTLKAGESANLKELTFNRLPQLMVKLHAIEHEGGQDMAHIQIDLGGAEADCGQSVKEIKENHFLVPRALPDDQRCSILYFCNKADAVSFLQIKVRRIDAVEQSAAIDVMHVRGRWQA